MGSEDFVVEGQRRMPFFNINNYIEKWGKLEEAELNECSTEIVKKGGGILHELWGVL